MANRNRVITQDEFITILADRVGYTKKDTYDFLKALIFVFEYCVRQEIQLKVKYFGTLVFGNIKARKGNDGRMLPPTRKIYFRLADNIRKAGEYDDED